MAVLAPTRAYAASLIALGTVMARAESRTDPMAHYERLAALPPGTPLLYRKGHEVSKARLQRRSEPGALPYLFLDINSNDHRGVYWERSIDVTQGWGDLIEVPRRTVRVNVRKSSPFLRELLGTAQAESHVWFSQMDCLLVGNMSQFESEMKGLKLGVDYRGFHMEGDLEEVLRPARLMGQGQPFRSHFVSPWTDVDEEWREGLLTDPYLVVCDGGAAFLQAREQWRSSHICVVMERHDTWLSAAVDLLHQGFLVRGDEDGFGEIPAPPRGLEVSVYREAFTG